MEGNGVVRVPPGPLVWCVGLLTQQGGQAGRGAAAGGGARVGLFPGYELPVPSVPNTSSPPGALAGVRPSPGLTRLRAPTNNASEGKQKEKLPCERIRLLKSNPYKKRRDFSTGIFQPRHFKSFSAFPVWTDRAFVERPAQFPSSPLSPPDGASEEAEAQRS